MTRNNKLTTQKVKQINSKDVESRIIAVGASAGGLEALKAFFGGLPEEDNNTYIVIQHLSPDHKSMMGELLEKFTNLPIKQIQDGITIEDKTIYLIPPKSNLLIEDGKLKLVKKPERAHLNLPIDMFMESLSRYKKNKAVAIILSGTGSDGTRGIRAIKGNDGMVMVQDPNQSKFDGMPKSAIQTGLVDYILPAEEMGEELRKFINAPLIFDIENHDVEFDQKTLSKILSLIDEKTGLDFREYKYSTLARRVARRVNVCSCSSLEEYYDTLLNNDEEIPMLYREFLIGVTNFFRDERVWEIVADDIIPELVESKSNNDILKIWDVACSTGEEAYSLAMLIHEEMQRQDKVLEVKIFATDISQEHLDIGSAGIYSESVVANVEDKFLKKFFVKKSEGYQIVEKIRRMVIFSKHNIIKNPPFSNMDAVFCRNLLIYFQASIQKKTMDVLHYSLKEYGFLVLGTSETVTSHRESFEDISRKWKIFRNVHPRSRIRTRSLKSTTGRDYSEREESKRAPKSRDNRNYNNNKQKFVKELNDAIMEQFGAASVYVDSEFNIMEAVGEFRKYANLPISGFTTNLIEMLNKDLKHVVQSTTKKAAKENKRVVYHDAIVKEGEDRLIKMDIVVKPFKPKNLDNENNFVLTFIEKEVKEEDTIEVEQITISGRTQEYIVELEEELRRTKEELQTSLEEIETSNEELQAANEELLASNEELQSTNEELQSVNEEINTVNAENIQKMDDLAQLNADMNNLLESTNIGTIFLDSDLRIRKFTPAIKKHFSLINADVGRPIDNFTTNFGVNRGKGLVDRCHKVMETNKTLERNILSKEGRNYLQRISPFRNGEDNTEGIVITFVDIESLQKAKNKLLASERRFKSFYEEDPVLHFSVDPKTSEIVQCNQEAVEKLEYDSKEDIIGKPIFELYEDESKLRALRLNKLFQEKGELKNVEQEMVTKNGRVVPVIMNSTVELDENGNGITNRFTCVDISELKTVQDELEQQKKDLQRANHDLEQFVSICSHDLQEPLSTIKFGSDILGKIYSDKLDQKGKDYIKYIDEASDRLSAQIKALLEHSRIGRNTKKKMVDTRELAEVVKYDLTKRIKDTNAKVHIGSLPKLKVYEVEMRLLFQNLLSNALKYCAKDKTPEVRISSYQEDEYWVFSVMDNGIGISEEDQKNIFTIFNRVPTEEKYEGTGVGLAHVHKIVILHGGTIWVDSQPGVGSTFYFKIKAK
ncbi:CheR family methyltransferase [Zunongwangia sp. HRR-M8]|uniref:CheR family methyltransferase n=1 Tax=Zunongwangia sp. HRR-M8 TaxID=3015170 RepID=UPI0022DE3923|nr:CheR family methyltransferase [Zunongwangia sp. HRR-M8]WBL21179.1 PAS domain-containing protein [Zunongwangia sp. HRR-M8]